MEYGCPPDVDFMSALVGAVILVVAILAICWM